MKRKRMNVKPIMQFVVRNSGGNRGKSVTAVIAPAHTVIFLAGRNNQIVSFFARIAGNTQTKLTAKSVYGNISADTIEILHQLCDIIGVFNFFWVDIMEEGDCSVNVAEPETREQLVQKLVSDFASYAELDRKF